LGGGWEGTAGTKDRQRYWKKWGKIISTGREQLSTKSRTSGNKSEGKETARPPYEQNPEKTERVIVPEKQRARVSEKKETPKTSRASNKKLKNQGTWRVPKIHALVPGTWLADKSLRIKGRIAPSRTLEEAGEERGKENILPNPQLNRIREKAA